MKTMLLLSVVLSILGIIYFVNLNGEEDADLLEANIEALTRNEVGGGFSECPGAKIYQYSGIITKTECERTHYKDSIDIVITYTTRECYACGIGSLEGSNDFLDRKITDTEYDKCKH